MKISLKLRMSILTLFVICIFLGIALVNRQSAQMQIYSFDPKDYGIPSQMGGYQVLAVVPSESTMCGGSGSLNLLLRAVPNQQITLTDNDLKNLGNHLHKDIVMEVTTGFVTVEAVKAQVDNWNRNMSKPHDCDPIGTDFSAYITPVK